MSYLHTGFIDSNTRSTYPFLPECSRVDAYGHTLPTWFIADLGLTLPTGVGPIHMSSAYIGENLWSVAFSDGDTPVLVATVQVATLLRFPGLAVAMTPLVAGAAGTVLFGAPPDNDAYAVRYTYAAGFADNARVMPSLIRAARHMPVRSLHTGPAGSLYARSAAGAVSVVGRGDIVVDADPLDANNIVFRLSGSRESYLGICDKSTGALSAPIQTVNGVAPDANGLLTIRLMAPGEEES